MGGCVKHEAPRRAEASAGFLGRLLRAAGPRGLGRSRRDFPAAAKTRAAQEFWLEAERREREACFRAFAGLDPPGLAGGGGFARRIESAEARLEARAVVPGKACEAVSLVEPLEEGRRWAFLVLDSGGGGAGPFVVQAATTLFLDRARSAKEEGAAFDAEGFLASLEAFLARGREAAALATGMAGSYEAASGRLSLLPFGLDRLALSWGGGKAQALELPASMPANAYPGAAPPFGPERRRFELRLEPGDSVLAYAGESTRWRKDAARLLAAIIHGGEVWLPADGARSLCLFFDPRRTAGAPPALLAAAALSLPCLLDADWIEEPAGRDAGRRLRLDRELAAAIASIAPSFRGAAGIRGLRETSPFLEFRAESIRPRRIDSALLSIERTKNHG